MFYYRHPIYTWNHQTCMYYTLVCCNCVLLIYAKYKNFLKGNYLDNNWTTIFQYTLWSKLRSFKHFSAIFSTKLTNLEGTRWSAVLVTGNGKYIFWLVRGTAHCTWYCRISLLTNKYSALTSMFRIYCFLSVRHCEDRKI